MVLLSQLSLPFFYIIELSLQSKYQNKKANLYLIWLSNYSGNWFKKNIKYKTPNWRNFYDVVKCITYIFNKKSSRIGDLLDFIGV